MDISYQSLNVLVFLIPGFIATGVLSLIYFHDEKETFDKVIHALVFTFIIYSIGMMAFGESPVTLTETKNGDTTQYSIIFNKWPLGLIMLLSVLLPLAWGYLLNNDLLTRILRFLKITSSTSRQNIWLDVFSEQKRYVIVTLSDGRRIFGWPMHYSSSPKDAYVYLYNPSWVNDDRTYTDMGVHGLFLVRKKYIDFIEFTHLDYDSAKKEQS